jgi:ribosome-binding protein aMBF1 (putative translation factor)
MSTQAHQDWTPVVTRRSNNKITKKMEDDIYSRVKFETLSISKEKDKITLGKNKVFSNETEDVKIKYVPSNISQLIINGRNSKNLTRKQLAMNLNFKEDVIADIENGKAIYNGNIIARIKIYLGVK